jgi:hypothetical protein
MDEKNDFIKNRYFFFGGVSCLSYESMRTEKADGLADGRRDRR